MATQAETTPFHKKFMCVDSIFLFRGSLPSTVKRWELRWMNPGGDEDFLIKESVRILKQFPRKRDVLEAFNTLKEISKGNSKLKLFLL